MKQSVPDCCTQPVCNRSLSSFSGSVGTCLKAYTDQWDHVTGNIFVRNVVCNGYTLEFAEGNSPPLSRVPFAFDPPKVESAQVLLNEVVQKLLEKGVIEAVEDNRLPGFYNCLFLILK